MPIQAKEENGALTVFLSGDIDHASARSMMLALDKEVARRAPRSAPGGHVRRNLYGQLGDRRAAADLAAGPGGRRRHGGHRRPPPALEGICHRGIT